MTTRRACLASALALTLTAGCASTGIPGLGGGAPDAIASETFAFRDASDGNISVEVRRVVIAGQDGFLPGDPNWIQLELTIRNIGRGNLTAGQIQVLLTDGQVIEAAVGPTELNDPPSFTGMVVGQMGLATAGAVVGTLLFPPAALIAGAATLIGGAVWGDRMMNRVETIGDTWLSARSIPAGSYVNGNTYIPAVTGISAVVVNYVSNSGMRSITLHRDHAAGFVPASSEGAGAAGEASAAGSYVVRTTATLRIGPTTSAQAIDVLRAPASVTPTGQTQGDWWEVRDASGRVGWIYSPLLNPR